VVVEAVVDADLPQGQLPVMELRKLAQEVEMVLAPVDNVVEVVAGGDRGAGHRQQHLLEGYMTRHGSRASSSSPNCFSSSPSRARGISSSIVSSMTGLMRALYSESERGGNHALTVNTKIPPSRPLT
jgi:hypothetical protein